MCSTHINAGFKYNLTVVQIFIFVIINISLSQYNLASDYLSKSKFLHTNIQENVFKLN